MSNFRQDILDGLEKKQEGLSSIYINGVMLLTIESLSNHLYLSAHCIREVLEKLENCLIKYKQEKKPLKSTVMELKKFWDATIGIEAITMDLPWELDMQEGIQSFLSRCEKFFSDSELIITKQKETALAVIQELMCQNGVDELSAVVLSDKAETWFDCKQYFIETAHLRKTTTDIFQEKFTALEVLLQGLLVPPRTFENMEKILALIQKGDSLPSRSIVKNIKELIHSNVEWEFFFNNISSPDWLEPLHEEGIFTKPEDVKIVGNIVRTPSWPAGIYLIKVAPLNSKKVIEILKSIPDTMNPNIIEACTDTLIALPTEISTGLVKKVQFWIDKKYQYNLFRKIALLIAKYYKSDKEEAALILCKKLLYIKRDKNEESNKYHHARNSWEYNEAIKLITESIVETDFKARFITVLCNNLERLFIRDSKADDDLHNYHSCIWRRDVSKPNIISSDDLKDILINWICLLASEISKNNEILLNEIFYELSKREAPIFSRIALHLLIENISANQLVFTSLLNENFLRNDDIWHEYSLLLKNGFPLLDTDAQNTILNHIASFNFRENETDSVFNESRRYRLFTLISGHLSGTWKDQVNKLKEKHNIIERPEYLHYFSEFQEIKPIFPISLEDFQEKSLREINQYLIEWVQPIDERYGESTSGLSNILRQTVIARFDEFSNHLELFKLENAKFVDAIIQGFSATAAENMNINWEPVLHYCLWIVQQQNPTAVLNNGDEIYNNWNSTKISLYRLLINGFMSKSPFSLKFRELLWNIIECGVSDYLQEKADEKEDTDYYHVAINTPRGIAFECTIRYGLWLLQKNQIHKLDANRDCYPELFTLLDRHLDVNIEKSKYIWAMYGKWFPWLFLLDKKWAADNSTTLFTFETPINAYNLAAWNSYLIYSQPYGNIFDILAPQYSNALNRLTNVNELSDENPLRFLIDHLVIFILRGKILCHSPIIDLLYKNSSLKIKLYIISYMGRLLNKDVLNAAIAFWEFRVSACNAEKNWDELVNFGWWVNTEILPVDWMFQQAEFVLEKTHDISRCLTVVESLVNLCAEYPKETFDIFKLIVDNKVSEHGFYIWNTAAESLIPILMESPYREGTITLIHKLGSYGLVEFEKFLEK